MLNCEAQTKEFDPNGILAIVPESDRERFRLYEQFKQSLYGKGLSSKQYDQRIDYAIEVLEL